MMERKGSVYVLVNDAIVAHEAASKKASARNATKAGGLVTALQHQSADLELRQQRDFMRLHPLLVRMPKLIKIDLCDPSSKRFPLTFCDDIWNGSVLDAYSITIEKAGNAVTKKKTENQGVYHVLSGGKYQNHYADVRIDTERARVLVSSVKGEVGRQGVVKGDVVTHFNGEEFTGTTKDLISAIQVCLEQNANARIPIVMNAERSIAEALRRALLVGTA